MGLVNRVQVFTFFLSATGSQEAVQTREPALGRCGVWMLALETGSEGNHGRTHGVTLQNMV